MTSPEGGPRISESDTAGGVTPQAERGRERFLRRRALIGAAVGGIGLPLAGFVLGGAPTALFFQTPITEIPNVISPPILYGFIIFEAVVGAAFGGVYGALGRRG